MGGSVGIEQSLPYPILMQHLHPTLKTSIIGFSLFCSVDSVYFVSAFSVQMRHPVAQGTGVGKLHKLLVKIHREWLF